MEVSTWGDFQSILQISVGFNAAYFTVSALANPAAANQRTLIGVASAYASQIKNSTKSKGFEQRLDKLRQQIVDQEYNERKIFIPFRFFSVIFFFVGIVLLFVTSVYSYKEYETWLLVLSAILNAPFTLAVFYIAIVASTKYGVMDSSRKTIERDIRIEFNTELTG